VLVEQQDQAVKTPYLETLLLLAVVVLMDRLLVHLAVLVALALLQVLVTLVHLVFLGKAMPLEIIM
jgi:hypothetical protein